ncbi:AMP-binding protein [Dysgonomonadaceae bacterium zrk40]|nr:AMP-binding protein [Dysgonomonadaceae bacterium zrk40]
MNLFDYLFSESKEMDKKFIMNEGEELSFKDLYERSLTLANYLSGRLGTEHKILLISQNSRFFITCYLAIIKSGNVCVPLNPSVEQENLDYIADATGCNWSFVSDKSLKRLSLRGETCNESRLEEILRSVDGSNANSKRDLSEISAFDESRLAEILFTSGSTGLPKGVMLTHLNLRANTESILSYLKLNSGDSILLVLPLYYCYGLSVLHTHLKVGASILLNNNFVLLGSVIDNLVKYELSGFAGVPSHFQMLLRKSLTFKTTRFTHLRYVTQAGGKLHEAFIEEFVSAFPDIDFFVMYGQTEATARLTYLPSASLKQKMGSVGIPIPGVTLDIVDHHGQPTKAGEAGEIIAKGKNIMSRYYNDPAGTSETLIDGWLYTGDLGYFDKDGFLFLTARKKGILKIGGHRISPKEIEEVIVSIPEVVDCTVTAVEDELLGEAIRALVVVNEGCDRDDLRDKIKRCCKQKLACNKMPKIIEFSLLFDLNAIGKKVMHDASHPITRDQRP